MAPRQGVAVASSRLLAPRTGAALQDVSLAQPIVSTSKTANIARLPLAEIILTQSAV
jgi:hypothetical protein